jgi:uncharacterized protein YbjT (DUF2867 family)
MTQPDEKIVLTGATGFVGGHLWPELERRGYAVTGMTRHPQSARERFPKRAWVYGDVEDPDSLAAALRGCRAAFYLVHSMSGGGKDYRAREIESAKHFSHAAAQAGLERIIYLGGVAAGALSEHLRSRVEVGQTLRAGAVAAVELRASMIIGHGSESWLIVRDLAARLPFMVLPRWLNSHTEPIAIDDVTTALADALRLPLDGSQCFDLPGPEALSGEQILRRTAQQLGLQEPVMVKVPVLTPWLSSHWVRFVTRAEWSVAREIVVGLTEDLLAQDRRFWELTGHEDLIPFNAAASRALEAEAQGQPEAGSFWRSVETKVRSWRAAPSSSP